MHATKEERAVMRQEAHGIEEFERPKARADCVGAARPCPFVSCRYHLYLDVVRSGNVLINRPELEGPEGLDHSCVLDLADAGSYSLEDTGKILNITRERVRQIEVKALRLMREDALERNPALVDFVPESALVRQEWKRTPRRTESLRRRLGEPDRVADGVEDEEATEDYGYDTSFAARKVWDLSMEETPLRLAAAADMAFRAYMNSSISKGLDGLSLPNKFTRSLASIEAKLDADASASARRRTRAARVRHRAA